MRVSGPSMAPPVPPPVPVVAALVVVSPCPPMPPEVVLPEAVALDGGGPIRLSGSLRVQLLAATIARAAAAAKPGTWLITLR